MNTPTVSFADVILGGSSLFDWEFRSGTAPVERTFTVSKPRADALVQHLGKPGTLRIVGPRQTLEVEQIYLLEIQPGDDPFTARIRLADRRWLWPKRWVATSFNVRLTTGDKFLAGEGRIENKLIQPDIAYARYSLRNEATPWKGTDALQAVFAQLGTPVIFESTPPETELQDVIVDDSGAAAVERVLAFLPGASVYIDKKGNAVVYDTFSGTEREVLAELPPRQRDGAWVEIVDRRATRPGKVVVLFTIEAEVRHDHEEDGESVGPRTEDEPRLYQVGPVPDVELTLAGESQPLARSSWAELGKMFASWGAFGIFNRAITYQLMRKHAFKYGWASFEQAWGNHPLLPPDSVNLARAATAVRCWRRLFRLDRFWRQRLQSIRAYRTAIVNYETGAYAPSTVYSDWIRRPSYKGFARAGDQNTSQGWAVRGYADRLADAEPAPARVTVVDESAGVISVEPQIDPYGLSQAMALGYPQDGLMPSQDLGQANLTGQAVYALWDRVVLEAGWKMSVVLTVVPGSPNDIRRFYAVEVPSYAVSPDPGPAVGPTVYARVFPGVMTARFAWSDDERETILGALKSPSDGGPAGVDAFVTGGDLNDAAESVGTIWPESLLTNSDLVRDVALATAARIYDTLRDRPLGGGTVDMRPDLVPTGTISGVRHSMVGGEMVSSLSFPAVTQPADIWRYLNASTRAAILRVLHARPGGVA